ncbi:Asp-tRNA(Asn)/Glu-tRNA(Gln) amidotransferase subunit GatC [Candidatus Saccharibacteria bacterium]|jgi:aspartyl-tRNA(Asn)/glutamyl-tRNA(Gln) amidotransferase subunit C|nr:Asp-tRNA(Asn)/Glu-tRNA(Gln) amidotransferase subunit GatC [Candidatus Saccharibacteria bacterium]
MTKITDADIRKLATLSRLKLTDNEIPKYKQEISSIMQYVEILQDVDLSGLEPTSQVTGLQNVIRADELIDYKVTPKQLLSNAPATQEDQLKVNRMIG